MDRGPLLEATTVKVMAWQVREEGFDARRGDRLSWRVTPLERSGHISVVTQRIDYVVDTYLQLALADPEYLRLDGTVESVESVSGPPLGETEVAADDYLNGPFTLATVPSTLLPYDPRVDSFIVTLQPGARVSASVGELDTRYTTTRD